MGFGHHSLFSQKKLSEKQRGKLPESDPPTDTTQTHRPRKDNRSNAENVGDGDDEPAFRGFFTRRRDRNSSQGDSRDGLVASRNSEPPRSLFAPPPSTANRQTSPQMNPWSISEEAGAPGRRMGLGQYEGPRQRQATSEASSEPQSCNCMVGNSALTRFGTCDAPGHGGGVDLDGEEVSDGRESSVRQAALARRQEKLSQARGLTCERTRTM
ncbi:hypothetical protein EV126DRAFT_421953 [Verticillium dahliae]|nr:hypothetical protein EV126DRAFT_421953 [Verticillium dahliae]